MNEVLPTTSMEKGFTRQGGPTNHTKEVLPITGPTQSLYRGVLPGQTSSPSGPIESYEGGPTYRWSYPTFMEREFTHQGCPTHSGLTESHEGGPTYNLYGEGVSSSRRSYLQQVLPNLYGEGVHSIYQVIPRYLRSYLTSTREVQLNLHEERHYRPGDPTSIYQVLPRYLRSYPTSTREVQSNLYEE
ncbi:hypothetical protein Fot_28806 [Forsythia ovata]|uniref:Uncharacterized protein n=1 Tax=Forsythia ovata TaxID=205694 RepID=A0ABD1TQT8_9LAMI